MTNKGELNQLKESVATAPGADTPLRSSWSPMSRTFSRPSMTLLWLCDAKKDKREATGTRFALYLLHITILSSLHANHFRMLSA